MRPEGGRQSFGVSEIRSQTSESRASISEQSRPFRFAEEQTASRLGRVERGQIRHMLRASSFPKLRPPPSALRLLPHFSLGTSHSALLPPGTAGFQPALHLKDRGWWIRDQGSGIEEYNRSAPFSPCALNTENEHFFFPSIFNIQSSIFNSSPPLPLPPSPTLFHSPTSPLLTRHFIPFPHFDVRRSMFDASQGPPAADSYGRAGRSSLPPIFNTQSSIFNSSPSLPLPLPLTSSC